MTCISDFQSAKRRAFLEEEHTTGRWSSRSAATTFSIAGPFAFNFVQYSPKKRNCSVNTVRGFMRFLFFPQRIVRYGINVKSWTGIKEPKGTERCFKPFEGHSWGPKRPWGSRELKHAVALGPISFAEKECWGSRSSWEAILLIAKVVVPVENCYAILVSLSAASK